MAEAAYGGLKPPPTGWLRRTFLHLPHSMTLSRLLDTTTPFNRRVGPGDFAPRPSRPGDLHPEPLTDSGRKPLDLSGSCHPLKAAASHRDRRVPPVIPLTLFDRDAGDLLPSLLGRYPVSTLIRSSPPLGGASVLSDSWFVHLCLFPFHRQPGSQVPHESPD